MPVARRRTIASMTEPTAVAPPAAQDKSSRAVAVLLAIAAIVAAIVTARASLVASDATSDWNKSVAREQKRGALLLQGIRYTYGTEGDQAFMLAAATVTAQALREAAAGAPAEVKAALEAEAAVQQQVVDLVGPAMEIVSDPRYALPDGGYDLQLRLADAREADLGDPVDDPLDALAAGDAAQAEANRLMLATLGIGAAFLCGALAQAFTRRRRPLLVLGWLALAAGAAAALAIELGVRGIAA